MDPPQESSTPTVTSFAKAGVPHWAAVPAMASAGGRLQSKREAPTEPLPRLFFLRGGGCIGRKGEKTSRERGSFISLGVRRAQMAQRQSQGEGGQGRRGEVKVGAGAVVTAHSFAHEGQAPASRALRCTVGGRAAQLLAAACREQSEKMAWLLLTAPAWGGDCHPPATYQFSALQRVPEASMRWMV